MKNFTCLLVVLLATSSVFSAASLCPASIAASSWFGWVTADASVGASGIVIATDAAYPAAVATVCANSATNCCDVTKMQTFLNTRLTAVKTSLVEFATSAAKFGASLTKIMTMAKLTDLATHLPAALAVTDLSGASDVQAKAFIMAYSTGALYTTDFDAFKGQAVDCFNFYSAAYQRIACHGCVGATSTTAPWTVGEITINAASCAEFNTKCGKVWNFMHKVGWAASVAAYVNKKRDATKTYTFPLIAATYYMTTDAAVTLTTINTAMTNCGADATVATCTAADKAVLCKAFIKLFDATAPIARADTTIVKKDDIASSITTRRVLVTAATGVITAIAETGHIDVSTAGAGAQFGLPATPVTFTTTDTAAWSSGYVAPIIGGGSSSGNTGTKTTSSAKIVIGTILSAIFAVALLN
jgi:hypothetical protein